MSIVSQAPSAPTTVRFSANYSDGALVYLLWSGAVGNPSITHYLIQQCESSDGVTWGDWHWNASSIGDTMKVSGSASAYAIMPNAVESYYKKCRIQACYTISGGTTYGSEWVEVERPLRRLSNTALSDWAIDKSTADAGESVTVDITQTYQADYVTPGLGYTHKVLATFGDRTISAELVEYETTTTLTLPLELLEEMPEDTSAEGTITVETYREGSPVGSTSQAFTLTCPESVVPTLTASASRLLTVGGVMYPDVTGGYVQGKSAVLAEITEADGAYGSYIVSYRINVAGRHSDGYNSDTPSLSSVLLADAGDVPVTYTVTDSRGRTASETVTIFVEPYSPPQATFKVWRVDSSGNADAHGTTGKYEYDYTYTDLGGLNTCTASLTAAGQTVNNVPKSGDVLPNNLIEFSDSTTYSVVLTLTDAYGSELFASVMPAHTGTTVVIRPAKPREKRRMIFGEYDTALDGLWTLTGWTLPEPEYQSNFVAIPGRHGLLDLSTVLTDGEPIYGNRTLTATFECSEGTRLERNERISDMVNSLDGRRVHIVLPDDQTRYLDGRVSVRTEYSDPVHASVTVTAECDPWRYNVAETNRAFALAETEQQAMLVNKGRRIAVPTVTVLGEQATLRCNGYAWKLYDGVYTLPDLALARGKTVLTYSGKGTLIISYREAVL